MSAIHERQWRLERERQIREKERKRREQEIKQMTSSYLQQYEQRLQALEQQGLAQFVNTQVSQIRNEINRIRLMNAYDGRNLSFEIRNQIQSLWSEAIEARRIEEEHQQFLAQEAQREAERLQEQKEQAWQQATNWENKLARNLAFKTLSFLKKKVKDENWDIIQIQTAITAIKHEFEQKAFETQATSAKQIQQKIVNQEKQNLLKVIQTTNIPQSQSELLKQQLKESDGENLSELAIQINQAEDVTLEDEAVRKEMVKAVYQSLKQAGFTVLNPKKQGDGDDSVVVIQASRPQGNQANFRVKLDGSVRYEFDNYKGQSCKKDMAQVLPKLSDIYGVDLSDERVIWENPDDESATSKPITPIHTYHKR